MSSRVKNVAVVLMLCISGVQAQCKLSGCSKDEIAKAYVKVVENESQCGGDASGFHTNTGTCKTQDCVADVLLNSFGVCGVNSTCAIALSGDAAFCGSWDTLEFDETQCLSDPCTMEECCNILPLCAKNEKVVTGALINGIHQPRECIACPDEMVNDQGDNPADGNTRCYPAAPCSAFVEDCPSACADCSASDQIIVSVNQKCGSLAFAACGYIDGCWIDDGVCKGSTDGNVWSVDKPPYNPPLLLCRNFYNGGSYTCPEECGEKEDGFGCWEDAVSSTREVPVSSCGMVPIMGRQDGGEEWCDEVGCATVGWDCLGSNDGISWATTSPPWLGSDDKRPCTINQRVNASSLCVDCPAGKTRSAGDIPGAGAETSCASTFCDVNEKVVSNICTACASDEVNDAGNDASGIDTFCKVDTSCAKNHRVVSGVCTPCADGLFSIKGSDPAGQDTVCYPPVECQRLYDYGKEDRRVAHCPPEFCPDGCWGTGSTLKAPASRCGDIPLLNPPGSLYPGGCVDVGCEIAEGNGWYVCLGSDDGTTYDSEDKGAYVQQ